MLWPQRADRRLRAIAIVFLGTLGAGQVLNFYAQPQDPQMQINVMPWLTVAWGLLLGALVGRSRVTMVLLALLSLAPLAWNVSQLARFRGGDRAAVAAVAALEQRFPPASTVFVYWGFEPIAMWQYALWSRTWDWDGAVTIAPAPSADPKFKWIAVDAGAIRHPDWTAEQHAAVDQARHRPGARPRLQGRRLRRLELERRRAGRPVRRPVGGRPGGGHPQDAARQLRGAARLQRSRCRPLLRAVGAARRAVRPRRDNLLRIDACGLAPV